MKANKRRLVRRVRISQLVAICLMMASAPAFGAGCAWLGRLKNWNHYYNGQIGANQTVRFVVAFDDCKAHGSWFDSINFKEFHFHGAVLANRTFVFALDSEHKTEIAEFRGKFHMPYLTITGAIEGSNGYHGQHVRLVLSRTWDGDDAKVAAAVGISDQASFNRATLRFWKAVRDDNVAVVSKCIHYPLKAIIYRQHGQPRAVEVTNAAMLKRDYHEVFNRERRDAILSHLPRHLIWGDEGNTIRLGNGAALFNAQGEVIRLP